MRIALFAFIANMFTTVALGGVSPINYNKGGPKLALSWDSSPKGDYLIAPNVYVLGSLAKGVTVYSQQIRSLNLAAVISEESRKSSRPIQSVAVIGGGISGLTLVAGLLATSNLQSISLFEKLWDLCPLQQGSDTRWLHPRIYNWPSIGSRNPSAALPVLDWSEGRASDIASTMLSRFMDYCVYAETRGGPSLEVTLGLSHIGVDAARRSVEWIGRSATRRENHYAVGASTGETRSFDAIVLAVGFGLENDGREGEASYWRNDRMAQPDLAGGRRVYVISGYGDGALVDLFRLTIGRFRQDLILDELFESDIDEVEGHFRSLTDGRGGRVGIDVKAALDEAPPPLKGYIESAIERMRLRLRSDTLTVLHVRKQKYRSTSLHSVFKGGSSFLNRVLLYILYRAGGFALRSGDLDDVIRESGAHQSDVVRRHGTQPLEELTSLFTDPKIVKPGLARLKLRNASVSRMWKPGLYPYVERRGRE